MSSGRMIYKVSSGEIFTPDAKPVLGRIENQLIDAGEWGLMTKLEDDADIMAGRCFIADGEITLLPVDQWPENQLEEIEVEE